MQEWESESFPRFWPDGLTHFFGMKQTRASPRNRGPSSSSDSIFLREMDDLSLDSATTATGVSACTKAMSATTSVAQGLIHPIKSDSRMPTSNPLRCQRNITRPNCSFRRNQALKETSRIRSNYLHRLGLTRNTASPTSTLQKPNQGPPPIRKKPPTPKSSVRFNLNVEIHSIPNRQQYPYKTKQLIWMQPAELEESLHRNTLEFAAEGNDWRLAKEEDEFVWFENNLVHPVHVRCNFQRQFLMILSAQCHQIWCIRGAPPQWERMWRMYNFVFLIVL